MSQEDYRLSVLWLKVKGVYYEPSAYSLNSFSLKIRHFILDITYLYT